MAIEPDEEERFRSLRLDAAGQSEFGQVLGQFDRSNLVLWVSDAVSSHLDSRGGSLPEYEVRRGDMPLLHSFSTQLHEIIHYWQTVGSTAGFIHALGTATATYATLSDLRSSAHASKPILKTLSPNASANDPAYRVAICWTDIEHGLAVLDDPTRTARLLQRHPERFVSVGHSLLTLCANTLGTLGEGFDPGFDGLIDPGPWGDVYEHYVGSRGVGFSTEGFLDIPLGLREIVEGQARVCEIQFRTFTQRAMTWKEVENAGWLSADYGKAFRLFLVWTGLHAPQSPRSSHVDLFLLLCDIAINPSIGYAEPLQAETRFVPDFHPGIRFFRLCQTIAKDRDLIKDFRNPTLKSYESVTKRLCEPLKWKTPVEVAQEILVRWGRSHDGDILLEQHSSRVYGNDDIHRRFIIGEHRDYLESRIEIPHFFVWPVWHLLVFDDDTPEYAENIQKLLPLHHPPFTAQEERGVTTCSIERVPADRMSEFCGEYFTTLALYELSRQWIAKPGEFLWNRFIWKRPLSEPDIEGIKRRFEAAFGLSLDAIRCL